MNPSRYLLCLAAASGIAAPAFAQNAPTAFDGVYQGVSRQLEAGAMETGRSRGCDADAVPAPLRISGGVARAGTKEHPLEGTVTPEGVLVMRSAGGKLEGQIDAQGRATGRLTLNCSYRLTWQRR